VTLELLDFHNPQSFCPGAHQSAGIGNRRKLRASRGFCGRFRGALHQIRSQPCGRAALDWKQTR